MPKLFSDFAKQENPLFNCQVVGVGGQGVVFTSRLLATACINHGFFVRTAETIGMSQRGGSVASHIRVAHTGLDVPSSLIPTHTADLIVAFEPGEALRVISQLAPSGMLICSTHPQVPSTAAKSGYDGHAQLSWLSKTLPPERLCIVSIPALISMGLSIKSTNVALIGVALSMNTLPVKSSTLRACLRKLLPARLVSVNEQALDIGMRYLSTSKIACEAAEA